VRGKRLRRGGKNGIDTACDITYDVTGSETGGCQFQGRQVMAKTKEEKLQHLYDSPKHCTLKDLEDALDAYDFKKKKGSPRSRSKHVWNFRAFVVVLHTPHEKFAKPGAVEDVITNIELAETARGSGNGQEKGS